MRKALLLSVVLLCMAVMLSGCPTFYDRFQTLRKGMPPAQVRQIMEEQPTLDNIDANGTGVIIYRGTTANPLKIEFENHALKDTLWVEM